jgi:hypothetical protein
MLPSSVSTGNLWSFGGTRAGAADRGGGRGEADRDGQAAAVIVGAVAGLLPVIRAARLSPTEALLSV